MSATLLGQSGYGTAISLGTVFNALAIGAVAVAPFSNAVSGSTPAYEDALLELVFGSPITTGATSPSLVATVAASADGTNFDFYGLFGSALYPIEMSSMKPLAPSAAYAVMTLPIRLRLVLGSAKLVVWNNTGVAFPSSVIANLYPGQGLAG